MDMVAAALFALALLHTFSVRWFERLAHRRPRHAGLWHLLAEVEVVFGFWAIVLLLAMAALQGPGAAVTYAESRRYTEPLFVFVIMVIAGSRPVLALLDALVARLAGWMPMPTALAQAWLCLALVPLLGSLVTEPAAMTLAALLLAPLVFHAGMPERVKYAALGVLFVNISIGGTLTSFAAPPVLMVAQAWQWDSAFMAATFGWRAAIAVLVNATVMALFLHPHLPRGRRPPAPTGTPLPLVVSAVHLGLLALVVAYAHHPVVFLGVFLVFLGYVQAYPKHQSRPILKEALLVGFFLAGLVVLGGLQQWWLQPVVSGLQPTALFFGALGLTAITDNAALTYLGSLIAGITPQAQYMLVSGAVAGGGLTVIANAPNPAGVSLLKAGFGGGSIGFGGLLAGSLPPTTVAAVMFLV